MSLYVILQKILENKNANKNKNVTNKNVNLRSKALDSNFAVFLQLKLQISIELYDIDFIPYASGGCCRLVVINKNVNL